MGETRESVRVNPYPPPTVWPNPPRLFDLNLKSRRRKSREPEPLQGTRSQKE